MPVRSITPKIATAMHNSGSYLRNAIGLVIARFSLDSYCLVEAVAKGNVEEATRLFAKVRDPNLIGHIRNRQTLLDVAIQSCPARNLPAIVELLLTNTKTRITESGLRTTIGRHIVSDELFSLVLNRAEEKEITPSVLGKAIQFNRIGKLEILLKSPQARTVIDRFFAGSILYGFMFGPSLMTPLQLAIENHNLAAVNLLVGVEVTQLAESRITGTSLQKYLRHAEALLAKNRRNDKLREIVVVLRAQVEKLTQTDTLLRASSAGATNTKTLVQPVYGVKTPETEYLLIGTEKPET